MVLVKVITSTLLGVVGSGTKANPLEVDVRMHMERVALKSNVRPIARLGAALLVLLGVTFFQTLGLPQPITGPIVNAALFATALWVGPWHAVGVGVFTPVVAFARGILAAPLAPMIPFIAIGNGLMVALFAVVVRRSQPALGVVAGSITKYLLLATAVRALVSVPEPVTVMMQWPQLMTALGGGFLVLGLDRFPRLVCRRK